ncbi:MAG: peptidoglycan DD-metalloendopeptidase family protein [Patescibacteria group bacterium]|nr:peptidoglycan DD-metalloendopeptidase family protein [bacterium]MDZ4227010.1 peptidoglycan DD-metalloendopeptidase family protein [Patescibacteria group bacterium]
MRVTKLNGAGLILLVTISALPFMAAAQKTASEIQQEISAHNAQIAELDKEIARYQAQLDEVADKKQTLQTALSQLNISIKKVSASINLTKNQIGSTELQIQQLAKGIDSKQASIEVDRAGLAESLRNLNAAETRSLVVQILNSESVSDVWQDVETLHSLQSAMNDQIRVLATEKKSLAETKVTQEEKRAELVAQQRKLLAQQGSLSVTKKAQNELLDKTKNEEATYQSILSEKQAARESFEEALTDLQAQLQYVVDPSQITPAGKGVLRWPLEKIRITQYFGNTAFAQSGAYNGKGHNGIDLAASIGTPMYAALTGTVIGTGNTDAVRSSKGQCYSFGKWVMIRHNNGLSTMYSHLSQINVSEGQGVGTGELIGYAGDTGYATGPHLHFGVYVSSATKIIPLGDATKSVTPCAAAVMPVAPLSGYLNPLNYLP